MTGSSTAVLTAATLPAALEELCAGSTLMRNLRASFGDPPLWRREPGFASLVLTILEQQVSLASAAAVYRRVIAATSRGGTGGLTPESFLRLSAERLRAIGFSRQKSGYCTLLAHALVRGELDLEGLGTESDDAIRSALMAWKGIGRWTADIYLLHSLGRPDIWPLGDLALQVGVQEALGLAARPSRDELAEIGRPFVPLRSVAARIFWNVYLTNRGIGAVE